VTFLGVASSLHFLTSVSSLTEILEAPQFDKANQLAIDHIFETVRSCLDPIERFDLHRGDLSYQFVAAAPTGFEPVSPP
jgi:hypothetical protein